MRTALPVPTPRMCARLVIQADNACVQVTILFVVLIVVAFAFDALRIAFRSCLFNGAQNAILNTRKQVADLSMVLVGVGRDGPLFVY